MVAGGNHAASGRLGGCRDRLQGTTFGGDVAHAFSEAAVPN